MVKKRQSHITGRPMGSVWNKKREKTKNVRNFAGENFGELEIFFLCQPKILFDIT